MPETSAPDSSVLRFGPFEVDVRSAELRKAGVRIALQDQPFRLLLRLLDRPGTLVTREDLRRELWPGDTFVDFERGLNTAVKRLRDALGDDADTPRFVETRPRRGYRFIAPVTESRSEAAGVARAPSAVATSPENRRRLSPFFAAVGAVAAVASGWLLWNTRARPVGPITRLEVPLEPAERLGRSGSFTPGGPRTNLAITRDGRTVVFSGTRGAVTQLFVRSLDRDTAEPIAGTDDAVEPILSPDGQWVAFWSRGYLRKVRVSGGPVVPICEVGETPMGAAWGRDDQIVFGLALDPLKTVSAAGGRPVAVTSLAPGELSHRLPQWLPRGNAVLFTIRKRDYTWGDEEIGMQVIGEPTHRTLFDGADARYLESGHLVFLQLGRLMAVRFDPSTYTVRSAAAGVLDDVAQSAAERNTYSASGAGQFATSASGTLVYARGGVPRRGPSRLYWVDRTGSLTPIALPPDHYVSPRLSPDGGRVVAWNWDTTRASVVVHDLARGTTTVLASSSEDAWPIWSPDGRDVIYQSFEGGEWSIKRRPADGTGTPQTMARGFSVTPASWSADSGTLAIMRASSTGPDETLAWRAAGPSLPLVDTKYRVTHPMFSPSAPFLAYVTSESGESQIYVSHEEAGHPRVQVSTAGGKDPVWSRDGTELFYVAPSRTDPANARLMSVAVSTSPALRFGVPRLLFESPVAKSMGASPVSGFDVAPDGTRFAVSIGDPYPPTPPVTRLVVVLNWFDELRARVR